MGRRVGEKRCRCRSAARPLPRGVPRPRSASVANPPCAVVAEESGGCAACSGSRYALPPPAESVSRGPRPASAPLLLRVSVCPACGGEGSKEVQPPTAPGCRTPGTSGSTNTPAPALPWKRARASSDREGAAPAGRGETRPAGLPYRFFAACEAHRHLATTRGAAGRVGSRRAAGAAPVRASYLTRVPSY